MIDLRSSFQRADPRGTVKLLGFAGADEDDPGLEDHRRQVRSYTRQINVIVSRVHFGKLSLDEKER